MGQLALDDPGHDLGVAVRVLVEAGAGREPLLVAGDERAEAEVVRVVVAAEGEGVPASRSRPPGHRRGTARRRAVRHITDSTVAPRPAHRRRSRRPPPAATRRPDKAVLSRARTRIQQPEPPHAVHPHAATLRRLEKSSGRLAAHAIARMDETLPWYRAMPPENRSWIGLVAQAGIAAFTEWFRHPETPQAISTDVFGTAPRELTRAITLRQTVEMVRTTIEVMESAIDEVAAPGDESVLREALLVYAREIAFATAQVYAQAAEARGAWDARLESLVVNAVLSGEADEGAVSRAAALGWNSPEHVVRRPGHRARRRQRADRRGDPAGRPARQAPGAHRGARQPAGRHRGRQRQPAAGREVPDRAVRGRARGGRARGAATCWRPPGPRRPPRPGCKACAAWQDAPRPVLADDLLPERAMAGDPAAREQLVEEIYRPLEEAGSALLETLSVYLEQASSLEGAARMLFVHPNTVRYRLRRVTDVTGWSPSDVRSAFTLRIALILGRLADGAIPSR